VEGWFRARGFTRVEHPELGLYAGSRP
jgi:hypothetical protein